MATKTKTSKKDVIEFISNMTVLELSELVKELERQARLVSHAKLTDDITEKELQSLLGLQERRLEDSDARQSLIDSQSRIKANQKARSSDLLPPSVSLGRLTSRS